MRAVAAQRVFGALGVGTLSDPEALEALGQVLVRTTGPALAGSR